MKKWIALMLALTMFVSLAACGGAAEKKAEDLSPEEIVAKVLEMQGQPIDELIAWLGEPQSRDYSSSCLIQGGQDGELGYKGFTVFTLVDANGAETVYDAEVVK